MTQTVDGGARRGNRLAVGVLLTALTCASLPAQNQDQTTITGTVRSSTRTTLVIRTEEGQYRLFLLDQHTTRPASVPAGSRVRVVSTPTDDPTVRLAMLVTVTEAAPPATPGAAPASSQTEVIPPSIRSAESSIERQAKRYHAGFQGGIAFNPELIDIGVHAKVGPFFNRRLFFRPSVDFGWGEVTRMFSINTELIYNLPFTAGARRYVYFGGGPGFNFVERSFAENTGVDFSDFKFDAALNILLGIQFPSGLFTELKTSVYASPAPVLRVIVGYTF